MSYKHDLSDFKRYLCDRNSAYRVDGLIFWQNRIPLPIDLFNRIFDESDYIISEYIHFLAAGILIFSNRETFETEFQLPVSGLPTIELATRRTALSSWITARLAGDTRITRTAYEIADLLGLPEFEFSIEHVTEALLHKGKKFARLSIPSQIQNFVTQYAGCDLIGGDNTDMFGNVIADRYNIYRSGFSDALAIIFNAMLDFRLLFSGESQRQNTRVIMSTGTNPSTEIDLDIRLATTSDGSLWEPRYENDHYVVINDKHPFIRNLPPEQTPALAELLFFLAQFENSQFSDENKKFFENIRQSLSRELWIRNE